MGKKITVDLVLQEINDKVYDTKEGVKNTRTVKFIDTDTGVGMAFKANKEDHPLKDWDIKMFDEFAPVSITIELPNVKQTKITDEF